MLTRLDDDVALRHKLSTQVFLSVVVGARGVLSEVRSQVP